MLKETLSTMPVLHLPDFTKPFMVDYDASGIGFDAVLHQGRWTPGVLQQALRRPANEGDGL